MTLALQILQIIFYSVSILFMITFMFIGIWSFILFVKLFKNKRSQSDILSKINKNIHSLSKIYNSTLSTDNKIFNTESVDKNLVDKPINDNSIE